MSAGLPRGAPLSTHFAIIAISASLSDGSCLKPWMPMFFSTNHGGITPACGPSPVRVLIDSRPRPHLLVGDERHRRAAVGTMAALAAALQDRRDVLREGDVGGRRRRLSRRRDGRQTRPWPRPSGTSAAIPKGCRFMAGGYAQTAPSSTLPRPPCKISRLVRSKGKEALMTRRFAYLIAATFALVAAPPAVMSASPAPRSVEVVDILVDGVAQPRFAHGGRWYVEAQKGREYAIRLRNPYAVRVAVALSVDGLNTIDARETTAAAARKWVIDPYETIVISGWQTSQTDGAPIRIHDRREIVRSGPRQDRQPRRDLRGFLQGTSGRLTCRSHRRIRRAASRPRARRRRRSGRLRGGASRITRRVRRHRHGSTDRPRRRAGVAQPRRHRPRTR